jgi:hypothetical protein
LRKHRYGLLALVLAIGFLVSSAAAQPIKGIIITPRTFVGGVYNWDDSGNIAGALEASNPKCILTVPAAANGISSGIGPNGSLLLTGSKGCQGSFQLFLSGINSSEQFESARPTTGGIGYNTGVYSGTFVIVDAPTTPRVQGTTVEWAGTFTEVFNLNPNGEVSGDCPAIELNFCTKLPANLYVTLELNAITWNVSR